jgi:hypothetical protein
MPKTGSDCRDSKLGWLRTELDDLEALIASLNPPLDPHTLKIARAKVATLVAQIGKLEEKGAQSNS